VTVREFVLGDVRRDGDLIDADVSVTCSSGTYIRALARDLGAALGVGGHLTCLRRTRVGPYRADAAHTLDALATSFALVPLADAAGAAFARLDLPADQAATLAHGGRLPRGGAAAGETMSGEPAPVAAFGPDGSLIALVTPEEGRYRPLAVFVP
jgi:tRNA pseudouridine55 synthase